MPIIQTMKLNTQKIDAELKRIDKSWYWLSKTLDTSWQKVRYWKDTGSLRGAEPIGKVLGIEPRDLIK